MMNRFDWKMMAAVCGLVASIGCSEFKKGYDQSFKTSYVTSFNKSCVDSAVKNKAPADKANTACQCMSKHLVDHYTSTELTRMSLNTESEESQTMLKGAVGACVASAQ